MQPRGAADTASLAQGESISAEVSIASNARIREWRGRAAIAALGILSVSGYALAVFAIDAAATGRLSTVF